MPIDNNCTYAKILFMTKQVHKTSYFNRELTAIKVYHNLQIPLITINYVLIQTYNCSLFHTIVRDAQ